MATLLQAVLLILTFCGLSMSFDGMPSRNMNADISGYHRPIDSARERERDRDPETCECRPRTPMIDIVKVRYVNADNIEHEASYLHPNVVIENRMIFFPPGKGREKLLEVPLGRIGPDDTIVITAANANLPSLNCNPRIGISDGSKRNVVTMSDMLDFTQHKHPPCRLAREDGEHDNRPIDTLTMPPVVTITFNPFYRYMACVTVHGGGYINTGHFKEEHQLDVKKPLFLYVERDNGEEMYYFIQFRAEVYTY